MHEVMEGALYPALRHRVNETTFQPGSLLLCLTLHHQEEC